MLLAITLLATAVPPAPKAEAPAPSQCRNPEKMLIDGKPPMAQPKRLDELPPGEPYLAVYHQRDGCMVPIKARDWRERRDRR